MRVREIMTANPATVRTSATLVECARLMRDKDIGSVIVCDDAARPVGVVTDRDIVVRAVAVDSGPRPKQIGDIVSSNPVSVTADAEVDDAIQIMRTRHVRRLLVLDGGRAVGIVSLGDLAKVRDPKSVLGEISAAAPNH